MRGSLRLGSFAGIGVYVHWTFAILIAWLLFVNLRAGGTLQAAAAEIGFVLAVFACVVLHEFGHALTARRFGVKTRDITILPIGGVARLERMPDKPSQEFLVAIAGPLVNVAIALLIYAGLAVTRAAMPLDDLRVALLDSQFFVRLLAVNVLLVLFNLLPAFPMDGGRVLRALLAMKYDYATATRIAARVGQGMAILFAIFGVFGNSLGLLLIAVFVFLGAQAEAHEAQARGLFAGLRVRDAMITEFRALQEGATLADAVQALLSGSQTDFPVVSADGRVAGVLPRDDLLRAVAGGERNAPIGAIMRRDCVTASEDDPLDAVVARIRESGCPLVPVLRDAGLVGLLTMDNLAELLMIRRAAATRRPPPVAPAPRTALTPGAS